MSKTSSRRNFKESHIRLAAITSSVVYMCLAGLYFSPADIPFKIAFPLASLTVASLWMCPWQITAALLFSTAGDAAGAAGNFLLQMGSFAITHVFLILYFIKRYKEKVGRDRNPSPKSLGYTFLINFLCIFLAGMSISTIVLEAPAGILRIGTGIYVLLICSMLNLALLQRSSLYALGAILFVFSDFILGWNKFNSPIENAGLLIMIPYYLGQWLIYIRSTPFRVGPEMRLMRF